MGRLEGGRGLPHFKTCRTLGRAVPWQALIFLKFEPRDLGCYGVTKAPQNAEIQPARKARALAVSALCLLLSSLLGHDVSAQPPSPPPSAITNTAFLAELAGPAKAIPFKTVVLATTGHRVLDFDTNNPAHVELWRNIARAAVRAGEMAHTTGLTSARANEAGNRLESWVRGALKEVGLNARVPLNATQRAQSAGYPDIEIVGVVPCYLELKTYSAATANTTQRAFYYSPSEAPKVTRDALHLLLAYELTREQRDGTTVFVPVRWKLLTLQDLEVDLKFEFNQSNRGLYGTRKAMLEEGQVK